MSDVWETLRRRCEQQAREAAARRDQAEERAMELEALARKAPPPELVPAGQEVDPRLLAAGVNQAVRRRQLNRDRQRQAAVHRQAAEREAQLALEAAREALGFGKLGERRGRKPRVRR